MSTKLKVLIGAGTAGALVMALALGVAGFWFVSSAFAQAGSPSPSNSQGSCHDNQTVFQLLGLSQQELLAQRQAGKSLLDIAKAKGVDEAKLTNALTQPLTGMHGAQSNEDQMGQAMTDQFAKDLRETKFGTMTDYHLGLGGDGASEMMGGTNGASMMDGVDVNQMMNGAGYGGMMSGSNGMMRTFTQ